MFYSIIHRWQCCLTNREHINRLHFPWPPATLSCQAALLYPLRCNLIPIEDNTIAAGVEAAHFVGNKWIVMTPSVQQHTVCVSVCLCVRGVSVTQARLRPIRWASGKSARHYHFICDTVVPFNSVWNAVSDFYVPQLYYIILANALLGSWGTTWAYDSGCMQMYLQNLTGSSGSLVIQKQIKNPFPHIEGLE